MFLCIQTISVSPENRPNLDNAICMVFDVFFHPGAIALISGSVRAVSYIFFGTLFGHYHVGLVELMFTLKKGGLLVKVEEELY